MVTTKTRPITVSLRITDLDTWAEFRKVAADQHMSANGLFNSLMAKEVARAKRAKGATHRIISSVTDLPEDPTA